MNSQRLINKVAIVTGASSGLGRAIAIAYSKEGARVVCADLSSSARSIVPEETAIDTVDLINQNGGKAIFVQTDVSDSRAVENMVNAAVAEFGRLDMLVAENTPRSLGFSFTSSLSAMINRIYADIPKYGE